MTNLYTGASAKNKRVSMLWSVCFVGFMALTVWVYLPGIQGPVLLDDHSSVTKIGDLTDSPELAVDYIFGDRSGVMGRSLSMATFVFERMVSDRGMPLSKSVNVASSHARPHHHSDRTGRWPPASAIRMMMGSSMTRRYVYRLGERHPTVRNHAFKNKSGHTERTPHDTRTISKYVINCKLRTVG